MRLIADGVVDREGVEGLARRVGYTPRHLTRLLTAELGAGPLALARARRAQTARVLIETTELAFADIAFAAGLLQRPAVQRHGARGLRRQPDRPARAPGPGRPAGRGDDAARRAHAVRRHGAARLPRAPPASRASRSAGEGWYARTLDLPHGPGTVRLEIADAPSAGETAFVTARFALHDLRDTAAAIERVRRLLDADCDPVAVADAFAGDPVIGPLVRGDPGLRVPGHVDGDEIASARCSASRSASPAPARSPAGSSPSTDGRSRPRSTGSPTCSPTRPPSPRSTPSHLPMPRARGRALVGLAAALAAGDVALDRGTDRDDVRRALLDLPGIGPWTADYIALRALGHPDVFLPTDLGVRDALAGLGHDPVASSPTATRWRPWRSYALLHLWNTLMPDVDHRRRTDMWTVMDSPDRRAAARRARRRDHRDRVLAVPRRRRPAPRRPRRRAPGARRGARASCAAYFARDLKDFDLPLAPVGQRLPAAGVGAAAGDRLRRDRVVRRDRAPARHDQRRVPRGRARQRPQPDPDRDPVPPGDRRQRHPHRLRRRPRAQADCCSSSSRTRCSEPSSRMAPRPQSPRPPLAAVLPTRGWVMRISRAVKTRGRCWRTAPLAEACWQRLARCRDRTCRSRRDDARTVAEADPAA